MGAFRLPAANTENGSLTGVFIIEEMFGKD